MKLYLFDSCPFCVPVRVLIGLKQLDCQLQFAQAGQIPDELASHIDSLKVPLLSHRLFGERTLMAESADIIRFLDQLGGQPLLQGYQVSDSLQQWLKDVRTEGARLCYPRMPMLGLPELAGDEAMDFFESSRAQRLGMTLSQALQQTEELVGLLQPKLESLRHGADLDGAVSGSRPLTIDDLYLFAELRNLAVVKELCLPVQVKAYLAKISADSGVSLYPAIDQQGRESRCHD